MMDECFYCGEPMPPSAVMCLDCRDRQHNAAIQGERESMYSNSHHGKLMSADSEHQFKQILARRSV